MRTTKNYDPNQAPAILMSTARHEQTYGVYNTWRAAMTQKMGGTFDWSKISRYEVRKLSDQMFDAAGVPQSVRNQYWIEWRRYVQTIK